MGFGVWGFRGLGFGGWGVGGLGFGGLGFRGLGVEGLGFGGLGVGSSGLGLRVEGSGFEPLNTTERPAPFLAVTYFPSLMILLGALESHTLILFS